MVGERSAERLKIEAGNALPNETPFSIEVSGQKFPEGVPRSVTLSSTEIYQALLEPLAQVSEMLKLALEQTPAELASDLAQTGIVMTGGGNSVGGTLVAPVPISGRWYSPVAMLSRSRSRCAACCCCTRL